MNRNASVVALAFAAAVVVGIGLGACSSNPPSGEDAGTPGNDAGQVVDSGTPDGGEMDAGVDAGIDAGTDAGVDAGVDAGADAGPDAGFEGVSCGATTCAVGESCCGNFEDGGITFNCAASCDDAGVAISCDGPEDCDGGAVVCCGTVVTDAGTPPNCPPVNVTATCSDATGCPTNVQVSCNSSSTIVRCHAAADCAGVQGYDQCCTYGGTQGAAAGYLCSSAQMAFFAANCAP